MAEAEGQRDHDRNRQPHQASQPGHSTEAPTASLNPFFAQQQALGNQAVQRQIQMGSVPPRVILGQQQTLGNQRVQRLLRGSASPTMQRAPAADDEATDAAATSGMAGQPLALQREGEGDGAAPAAVTERPTPEFFALEEVERARANFDLRFHRATNYAMGRMRAAENARAKLEMLSGNYRTAYDNYAQVIRRARQEAQNQEQWIGICVGIGAGILLGVGAAFVLPSTAAAAFTITAGEAAVAAASAAGQAAAGAWITSEAAEALQVAGRDLEPGGLSPDVLDLQIWRRIAEMYRSGYDFVEAARNLHMLSGAAEYLIGEIRVHVAGGETQMSEEDTLDMVTTLLRADHAMRAQDARLTASIADLERVQQAINAITPSRYPIRRMEQDIWIMWMADVPDPDVFDLDEIEDYLHGSIGVLGSGSRLNVDFGWYTSSDDENEARTAARREAGALRDQLREQTGGAL